MVFFDPERNKWFEVCPEHEGGYDCTPFCSKCEGNQEFEVTL